MKNWLIVCLCGFVPLVASSGCIEVGAEALYWQPCIDGYQYGEVIFSQQIQTANYDWGFRVYAGYEMCNSYANVDWARFRATTELDQGPFVSYGGNGAIFPAVSGLITQKFDYDRVSLRGGRYLCCCRDARVSGYAGARYVDLSVFRRIFATNALDATMFEQEACTFEGGGIEVGFVVDYDIWCNFSLHTRFGGAMMIGERHRVAEANQPADLVVPYSHEHHCLPALDFRLTFGYEANFCLAKIRAEIGYDLDYYFDLARLNRPREFLSLTIEHNVGFGGLIMGLSAEF